MNNSSGLPQWNRLHKSEAPFTEQEIRMAIEEIEQKIKDIERQRLIDGPLTTEERVFHHRISQHVAKK